MLSVLLAFVVAGHDLGVGPNFLVGDRDQLFLLPPDMREWLPEGLPRVWLTRWVESFQAA